MIFGCQCSWQNNKHCVSCNNRSRRKVGIFTEFLFFSHKATNTLCTKLGLTKDNCDTQSIYQFEARYFQYSVLAKNIRFCKDFRHRTNNNNKGKSYMIFKFGSISQVTGTEIYAICEENNRSKQQPWICQHIFTLDEMLQFFNLEKQALNVRQGFLNAMNIKSHCVSKLFDVDRECKSQTIRIWKMLDHSYQKYVREVETKCRNGENYLSGWISDDLVSTRSSGSSSAGSASGMSLLSLSASPSGNGNRSLSVTDWDCNSVCSSRSKYGNKGENKIKNEDKFSFLETLCIELGLGLDNGFCLYEHFNHLPDELYDLLSKSIEDAIKFAQKHPETVLTQAYIDEEHGSISYELVLIAEIENKKMNKYYKFAIPISECMNNNNNDNNDSNNDSNDNDNGKKYYKAENILTPKMVVDNVRLNTENATFKQGTWVVDIDDVTKSFYKQIDKTWYSNASSDDNNNTDENDENDENDESDENDENDESDESDESIKIEPPFKNRSISIELGVDIDCYKRQLQSSTRKSTKSASADMFGFSQDDIADNSDIENGSTKCDNYDKQSFYQIGLNIHGGSSKRSKWNNRGKYNQHGGFKNNNSNNNNNYDNRYNEHHNRGYHHSNNVYNNNSNNYNDFKGYNSWNNYGYDNNFNNNHYYNTNDSYFTRQSEQHSMGW